MLLACVAVTFENAGAAATPIANPVIVELVNSAILTAVPVRIPESTVSKFAYCLANVAVLTVA